MCDYLKALIRERRLFHGGYPKARHLLEARRLLEEIRYVQSLDLYVVLKKQKTTENENCDCPSVS